VPECEARFGVFSVCFTSNFPKLKVKEFEYGPVLELSSYFGYLEYWTEERVLDCGVPHYQHSCPEERVDTSGSVGPTSMGVLGQAHRILVAVKNRQAEHQSTVFKTLGTVADQTLSILIDPGATESFISSAALKNIRVKAFEHDEFSFVEIASGAKQKVGGNITGCIPNLGEFVTRANPYITILGSYDAIIGMDAILNCKTKQLSLVDDEGQRRVIVEQNQGVSLRFISSLQLRKSMRKG
jgi:hypothetical protein